MGVAQQSVEMTVHLYKARDASRFVLGEKYGAKMAEYMRQIKQVMTAKNVAGIVAASLLCKVTANPLHQMQILSAYVEMVEPSEVKK